MGKRGKDDKTKIRPTGKLCQASSAKCKQVARHFRLPSLSLPPSLPGSRQGLCSCLTWKSCQGLPAIFLQAGQLLQPFPRLQHSQGVVVEPAFKSRPSSGGLQGVELPVHQPMSVMKQIHTTTRNVALAEKECIPNKLGSNSGLGIPGMSLVHNVVGSCGKEAVWAQS